MEHTSPSHKLQMIKDYEAEVNKDKFFFFGNGFFCYRVRDEKLIITKFFIKREFRKTGLAREAWREFLEFINSGNEVDKIIIGIDCKNINNAAYSLSLFLIYKKAGFRPFKIYEKRKYLTMIADMKGIRKWLRREKKKVNL